MANAHVSALFGAEVNRDISDQQLLERYIAHHDEAAFVYLVRRYARSVWGVCRRVLRNHQDAEDAFQAVFFVLARKAASIRKGEAVGSWLYAIAYRTALKARQMGLARAVREQKASAARREETPATETAWRDLQRQLDEELHRLAEKYRAPFVLCCLEGMSRTEAARELQWKEGTVSSRLAQARKILQTRLARRGVALSAVLTAAALAQNVASAAAPAALVQTTASTMLAAQAGTLSPSVAVLADSVLSTMALAKLKTAIAVVVAVTMLLSGMGAAAVYLGTEVKHGPVQAVVQKQDAEFETFVAPPVPVFKPIDEQVLTLAFSSADYRLVAAGARKNGYLIIWDADTGNDVASARGIPSVRSVAFAPDGDTVATGDFTGSIRLRDARTGVERASVKGHKIGVNGVAFSSDGKVIASAGLDRIVKIWDTNELKEKKAFAGHTDMIYTVAYFRNGNAIVSAGKDKTAIIWNVETGKEKFTLRGHLDAIETVAVTPDDRIVATASWDHTVKLWNAETGIEQVTLRGHQSPVYAVAISPDGKKLASGDATGKVLLWNLDTKQMIGSVAKHLGPVWAVAFSHDGKYLASGSSDTTAKIWDLAAGKELRSLTSSTLRPVRALAYASDGDVFAIATADGKPRVHNARTGAVLHVLPGHQKEVTSLAFSPDGQTIATGSLDETVKLWDRATGKEKRTLGKHVGGVLALAFSPDSKLLASGGHDKTIRVWDAATGDPLHELNGHDLAVRALAFAPSGALALASGADDGTIRLWYPNKELETIKLVAHDGPVRALAFGGDRLASAGTDGAVKIWLPADGKVWRPNSDKQPLILKGHTGPVAVLAFLRGNRTLVSGGQDTHINIWDAVKGLRMGSLHGHRLPVSALAIHPAGADLLSGGSDGQVLRWGNANSPLPIMPVADPRAKIMPEPVVRKSPPLDAPKPKSAYAQEYYHSFKGNPDKSSDFAWSGPDAEQCVKFEAAGLRITLPRNFPHLKNFTGVATSFPIKGDFEITLGFEILSEPERGQEGEGTGFGVTVDVESAVRDHARFNRTVRFNARLLTTYMEATNPSDGKKRNPYFSTPADIKSGRLRIVRSGTILSYYTAEGSSDNFEYVHHESFSPADVKQVLIAGFVGAAQATEDVRIIDLRVRADALPGMREDPGPAATGRGRGWFVAGLSVGLVFTLILGAFLFVRLRRRPAKIPASAKPGSGADALAPISVRCIGCGKSFRIKPDLVGRKVKCPHCASSIHVPAP